MVMLIYRLSANVYVTQENWVMASDVPVSVTARSVEFGNISLATWIEHPVTSRISLIFDPPFPFAMRKFKIREEEKEEGK